MFDSRLGMARRVFIRPWQRLLYWTQATGEFGWPRSPPGPPKRRRCNHKCSVWNWGNIANQFNYMNWTCYYFWAHLIYSNKNVENAWRWNIYSNVMRMVAASNEYHVSDAVYAFAVQLEWIAFRRSLNAEWMNDQNALYGEINFNCSAVSFRCERSATIQLVSWESDSVPPFPLPLPPKRYTNHIYVLVWSSWLLFGGDTIANGKSTRLATPFDSNWIKWTARCLSPRFSHTFARTHAHPCKCQRKNHRRPSNSQTYTYLPIYIYMCVPKRMPRISGEPLPCHSTRNTSLTCGLTFRGQPHIFRCACVCAVACMLFIGIIFIFMRWLELITAKTTPIPVRIECCHFFFQSNRVKPCKSCHQKQVIF